MEDLLLHCLLKGISSNEDILASLKSEDYPFNNQQPPQAIGEHVVKVPKHLMALNNTTG